MSNMIFAEIYTPSSSIPHAISVVLLDENLRIKTAPYTAMDPIQRYMYEYVRHMPLQLLQPWQARFLCEEQDYFWDMQCAFSVFFFSSFTFSALP